MVMSCLSSPLYPVQVTSQTDLFSQTCLGYPVRVVSSQMSCPDPADMSLLSWFQLPYPDKFGPQLS